MDYSQNQFLTVMTMLAFAYGIVLFVICYNNRHDNNCNCDYCYERTVCSSTICGTENCTCATCVWNLNIAFYEIKLEKKLII